MLKESLIDILSQGTIPLAKEVSETVMNKNNLVSNFVGAVKHKYDSLNNVLEKGQDRLNEIVDKNNKVVNNITKNISSTINSSAEHNINTPQQTYIDEESHRILNGRLS